MAQEKLEILIQAKDQASAVVRQVDDSFSSMARMFTGAALGAGLTWAAGMARELATLGAQTARVEQGFRGLAGTNANEMMDKLRASSRGAIDDMNLMLSANRAMMLGVSQNADELARLMEVARVRGAAMGLSTQQAFQDLMTGIGRMSPLILDNLGILTGGEAAFKTYAASIGKTAEQLTDAERKQFLVNKVLESTPAAAKAAGDAAADAATKFESLAAQWQNAKAGLGADIAEATAPVIGAATNIIGRYNEATRAVNGYRDALREANPAAYEAEWAAHRGEVNKLATAYEWGRISVDEFKAGLDALLPSYAAQVGAIYSVTAELQEMAAAEAGFIAKQRELKSQAAIAQGYGAGMDPWLRGRTEGSGRKLITTSADIIRRDEEATRKVQQRMEDAQRKAELAATKTAKSGAAGMARAVRAQETELRSLIEGLLQPTKVTDLDMAQTKLGTYTDKWDEYVRRIRAGASDAKSQWRNLIPTDVLAQGQDAVNAWVASTEKAFYAGQAPDQINWDAFIGQAREQLAQKQARENLIAEAGRRLAAAGIGGGVQAAELLGLGGGGAGMDTEGLVQGVASSGVGITISATITDQIKGQGEVWSQTGAICMSAFLTGAQGAITPETGQKFIGAIWPWLAPLVKNVANQGYRQ